MQNIKGLIMMDKPSYFDKYKDLSNEELLFEIMKDTVSGLSKENQDKLFKMLKKGAKINGKRY